MCFQCKCIAHLLATNRTFISLTPAVVTSDMGFELLSILQGFLAKLTIFCAWNYMGHHPFNPFILVDMASIHPKTPQHIYLLIMALLEFLLETCDDRWKFSPRDEITEITNGVDSVGLLGEIISWCLSDGVGS